MMLQRIDSLLHSFRGEVERGQVGNTLGWLHLVHIDDLYLASWDR